MHAPEPSSNPFSVDTSIYYGKSKIFHTDNDTEFRNKDLEVNFEANDIKSIYWMRYHSETQGAV